MTRCFSLLRFPMHVGKMALLFVHFFHYFSFFFKKKKGNLCLGVYLKASDGDL